MPAFLSIPKERVAILVGTEGSVKAKIERLTGVELQISKEGQVTIIEKKGADPLLAYKARDVIRAIGRGFSPDKALQVLSDDNVLSLIDLAEYARNDKAIHRLKARVIGAGGKCRRVFEQTLGIYISVYGDTVGIIGREDEVAIARGALEKLLSGSMHATVYKLIERKKREEVSRTEWWQQQETQE